MIVRQETPPVAIECATVWIVASQLDSVCMVNRDRYSRVPTGAHRQVREPGSSARSPSLRPLFLSPSLFPSPRRPFDRPLDRTLSNKIAEVTSLCNEARDYPTCHN